MKVYILMSAFDTKIQDKIYGVYDSVKAAVKDANYYVSDDGPLTAIPHKISEIFSGSVWSVVNHMGNPWFYIVERSFLNEKDITKSES